MVEPQIREMYALIDSMAPPQTDAEVLSQLFQKTRDELSASGEPDASDLAQLELEAFSFSLRDGAVSFKFSGTRGDGSRFEFPDLSELDDQALDYLETRLNETLNPVAVARYAQILWASNRKHGRFATQAVRAWLEVLKSWAKEESYGESKYCRDSEMAARNLLFIAAASGFQVEEAEVAVLEIIELMPIDTLDRRLTVIRLTTALLDLRPKTARAHSSQLAGKCASVAGLFSNDSMNHQAIDALELCSRIEGGGEAQTQPWALRIAKEYEVLATQALSQGNLAVSTFCRKAFDYFKIAGDGSGAARMDELAAQAKAESQLQELSTPIDLTPHVEACQAFATDFVRDEPEGLLPFFALSDVLLPSLDDVNRTMEESAESSPILSMMPVSPIDDFGNTIGNFYSDEEKRRYWFSHHFQLALEFDKLPILIETLRAGFRAGLLDEKSITAYLAGRCWIGKTINRRLPHGHVIEYKWIDMIGPGIRSCMDDLRRWFLGLESHAQFVLSIDSLLFKFEGMLRDVVRLQGFRTTTYRRNTKSGGVESEMGLEELLEHEAVRRWFTDSERYFLAFLLTSRIGYNLRNRFGHGLVVRDSYNGFKLALIFLAVMRLTKLQIDPKPKS